MAPRLELAAPLATHRNRKVSVKEAAALWNISERTFRRHYQHLIEKVSPRRDAVNLGDVLGDDTPTAA
jgi:hypothetical protein